MIKNVSNITLGVGKCSLAPGEECRASEAGVLIHECQFQEPLLEAWRRAGYLTISQEETLGENPGQTGNRANRPQSKQTKGA